METNLKKAKRLLRTHLLEQGIPILEDGFIMKMLELAAMPDKKLTTKSDYDDPDFMVG